MPVARSLSTAYKRRVCLNKICVIVEDNSRRVFVNDINLTAFQILPDPTIFDIRDPNLLNKALLSIAASSYTGVDITPPHNNLCRDTNAPKVVGIVWSSFAVLAIVFILVLWVVCKLVLRSRGTSEESAPRLGVCFTSYVLGLLWAGIHFASIITDVILLGQVWGVWPMWFIMGSVRGHGLASRDCSFVSRHVDYQALVSGTACTIFRLFMATVASNSLP